MSSTGNLQLPQWAVHLLGTVMLFVVFASSNKGFMALLPPWGQTLWEVGAGFLTYASITQVQGANPQQPKPGDVAKP